MSNLLAFIILFGILVFIHELGHFLMAKYFKVGVEKFSLGYGPKIFGFRRGETEYLVSALPLGGYVKMVGDEPGDELDADTDLSNMPANSFLVKPPLQRIAIVIMGPIANLVLPIALFFVLYMVGQPQLSTEIGYVKPASPAAVAGVQPGDRITAIDGVKLNNWTQLMKHIREAETKPMQVRLAHGGESRDVTVTPELGDGLNPFGEPIQVNMLGVQPQAFLPELYVTEKSAAYQAGLRSGDLLTAIQIDGELHEVRYRPEINRLLARVTTIYQANKIETFTISIKRKSHKQSFQLSAKLLTTSDDQVDLSKLGIYWSELVIHELLPDGVASERGIKKGDILYALNGQPIFHWFTFQERIRSNQGEPVSLTVIRQGKKMDFDISPKLVEQKQELTGEKFKQRMLGIASLGTVAQASLTIERVLNPFKALSLSFARCYEIVRLTVVGFSKLITGNVSPKNLGGPILIYQLAGKSWESGVYAFINMIVLISITLGVLNLLPIPVLDGGHLMFYTIELIQGRPVRARTREWLQQIGVVFLIGLMIFAFYNDLGRISWGEIGWVNWLRNMFS